MTHKQNRAGNTAWKKLLALAAYALFVLSGRGGQSINGQAPVGAFAGQSDVGITPKAGSASFDDARHEYSITGGGENMWGTQDAFHFVWRRVSGDVTLTADVKLQGGGGNPHRKAGLMIRQGLAPGDLTLMPWFMVTGSRHYSIEKRQAKRPRKFALPFLRPRASGWNGGGIHSHCSWPARTASSSRSGLSL